MKVDRHTIQWAVLLALVVAELWFLQPWDAERWDDWRDRNRFESDDHTPTPIIVVVP